MMMVMRMNLSSNRVPLSAALLIFQGFQGILDASQSTAHIPSILHFPLHSSIAQMASKHNQRVAKAIKLDYKHAKSMWPSSFTSFMIRKTHTVAQK